MKKEDFIKLGLTEELAEKCEKASGEELKSYVPYDRFKELVDEKNSLKESVKDRDKQLEDLKGTVGNSKELKEQIEALQKESKAKDEAYQKELHTIKVNNAIEKAILGKKGKNATAIKALLENDKFKLDGADFNDDGTVKGLAERLEELAKTDEYLFDKVEKQPSFKGTSPAEGKNGVPTGLTKEEFNKMGYKEKVELYNTNKALYDSFTAE